MSPSQHPFTHPIIPIAHILLVRHQISKEKNIFISSSLMPLPSYIIVIHPIIFIIHQIVQGEKTKKTKSHLHHPS
jgi:hypothetical protein